MIGCFQAKGSSTIKGLVAAVCTPFDAEGLVSII